MDGVIGTMVGFVIEHAVLLILAPLVPLVATLIVTQLKRINIQVSSEMQANLEAGLMKGALWVEEWAAKKYAATGAKVPSKVKLEKAVEKGLQMAIGKIPRVSQAEAADIVESFLPQVGAGAAAGAAALGKAVQTKD